MITQAEYGLLGWQGLRALGGFDRALWTALERADTNNLNALAKGFPEEVTALNNFRNKIEYWTELRNRFETEKED
jgi:hypothetical protein